MSEEVNYMGVNLKSAEDIERHADIARNIVNGINSSDEVDVNDVVQNLTQQLQSLIELRNTLRSQEDSFFNSLNISGANRVEQTRQLQRLIDEWNTESKTNRYAELLVPGGEWETFLYEKINGISLDYTSPENQQKIMSALKVNIEDLVPTQTIGEAAIESFIKGLQEMEGKQIDKIQAKISDIAKISGGSAAQVISQHIQARNENGEWIIDVTRGKIVAADKDKERLYRQKTKAILDRLLKLEGQNTSTNNVTKKQMEEFLSDEKVPNKTNSLIAEMKQVGTSYDLNGSVASIRGFLGEVYWNLFFKKISKQTNPAARTKIQPTGTMRTSEGQEIPIDLIVNGFNFQIKNYQIAKSRDSAKAAGALSLKEGPMSIETFLSTRARITETSIGEAIKLLFASWVYNTPGLDEVANNTYTNISQVINGEQMNNVFKYYIANIINLSSSFEINKNNQYFKQDEREYKNTFFLVKDRLVPGSAIIDALIVELNDIRDDKIRIKFSARYTNSASEDSRFPNTVDANSLLGYVSIKYTVTININEILEKVYEKAENDISL